MTAGRVWDRHEVIGAEGFAAAIAMKLITGWAEEFAAVGVGAGMDWQDCVASVFVVFNGEAVEIRLAFGAGGGSESWSAHVQIIAKRLAIVNINLYLYNEAVSY